MAELMHFGTANGPTRLVAPVLSTDWRAVNIALVDGPPEPAITPVRGFDTWVSESPASAMAWPNEIWAKLRPAR